MNDQVKNSMNGVVVGVSVAWYKLLFARLSAQSSKERRKVCTDRCGRLTLYIAVYFTVSSRL